ncbi:FAD-dependent oxidoreductase [Rhodococcus sp. CX]|uniref:FAD-dependent oxidoreductase n=1 Tax=Rhodococcus sp. CX TaxID=2789880 RepID=UPI0018CDC75E|nr:FAD-dependent oxidoreductase [Rhodococcus sp. CX]MBH0118359.1 FAD-dependent oxidoreductase [Rhodococcus sp. CX]
MTEEIEQSLNCDLLIVGFGVTGACAALEARSEGADVLVLERASGGGGTSALSEGVIYLGGGTKLQRDLGIEDDVESMFRFLDATCNVSNKAVLRKFCDGSVAHFDWLEEQGVPFARELYTDKHICPPAGPGLFGTGNEKVWPYREIAQWAYRGHLVNGPTGNAGSKLMEVLLARCIEAGVRFIGDARVLHLSRNREERVTGAAFRRHGIDHSASARQGVLLATGGFQMNRRMVARDFPFLLEHGVPIGDDYSDGSGIEMAQEIGADVESIGALHATASIYPPGQLVKGIIVNKLGKRFVAEDSYHGRTAAFVFDQPDRKAYLIVDSEIFAYPELAEFFRYRLIDGWDSVAEMERGLGITERSLQKTLADYNEFAAQGRDPQFGKYPDWLKPFDNGPYAAFDLSADKVLYHYHSLGGLRVDDNARVIATTGEPIEGLYAAGSCAAGITQTAKGYASGMTLANGSFFGRVAARHATTGSGTVTRVDAEGVAPRVQWRLTMNRSFVPTGIDDS